MPSKEDFDAWLTNNPVGHPMSKEEVYAFLDRAPISLETKDYIKKHLRDVPNSAAHWTCSPQAHRLDCVSCWERLSAQMGCFQISNFVHWTKKLPWHHTWKQVSRVCWQGSFTRMDFRELLIKLGRRGVKVALMAGRRRIGKTVALPHEAVAAREQVMAANFPQMQCCMHHEVTRSLHH